MNAFGDIDWLPPPGTTPDQPLYVIERWFEGIELALARTPAQRIRHCLITARERLAEAAALIAVDNRAAAALAFDEYRRALDTAEKALAEAAAARSELALLLAGAVLEHQYIVATDYLDQPRATRTESLRVRDLAGRFYSRVKALLAPTVAASLFFKEEEVRYAWEVAQQADAQGL